MPVARIRGKIGALLMNDGEGWRTSKLHLGQNDENDLEDPEREL